MPRRAGLILGLLIGLGAMPAGAARLIGANGTQPKGYGRIALTFDGPVSVKARLSGGVLVLSYGERTAAGPERLAAEMPDYVAMVRRDPDGGGLRLALQKTVRVNVQEAGERVFVDLISEGWSGLPPPLPPEVVSDLARRARLAEAALKARNPAPARKPLAVEIAQLPTLTRLSVRVPPNADAASTAEGAARRLRVAGAWTFDLSETRGRLPGDIARVAATTDDTSAGLLVTPAEGYTVSADRDDDAITFDIVKTAAPKIADTTVGAEHAKAAAPPAVTRAVVPAPADVPSPAPVQPPDRRAGSGLVFPFRTMPPAALFERAGIATLVFETDEPVRIPEPGASGLRAVGEPLRFGRVTVLRFAVPPGALIDLLPVGPAAAPTAWELAAGDGLSPSDGLAATRLPEASGRSRVAVGLQQPGSVSWLDLDGERVAVVTMRARKAAGLAKRQRFVDFELLPSRTGLAVLAEADDLTVRADLDGVAIGRDGGLAVSPVAPPAETPLGEAGGLAVRRGPWEQARLGDVRETVRAQFAASVAAPVGARGPLRLTLARTLLANGLDPEALDVLDAASADDPLLAGTPETAILRGLALIRIGRSGEARRVLGSEAAARDPEAALWRAVGDAQSGLWREAEAGFRRTLALVDRYPADLQALIRTVAAETAVETGDLDSAMRRIATTPARDLPPLIRDRLALVRARVDEATDRTKVALEGYERLAESGEPPVAVAASLRATRLAHATGRLKIADAIERLERLGIAWHGGETENAVTVALARAYMAAGRWRDAFNTVRAANARAPDSEESRTLNGEAQALFDDLYLSGRGDAMGGVEAVALYFDFKDFAPIGRRGDAVVRRLAERLVGLDLLESAADLLQYQVDNRLTGAGRASVATQLATIRLMDGKPLMALSAIESSYLPELPGDLRRARALLRARALSDLSRTDLALEAIEGEAGADAVRLRADILWTARRWREAGEAHEALLGDAWRAGGSLDETARADAIRAAIAYDLAGEAMGLERLKAKFSGAMAESADARTFALLTAANAARAPGFREIAQRATGAETLAAFLAEYRKRYPDAAVPARGQDVDKAATETRADGPSAPPG